MKRYVIAIVLVALTAAGCASTTAKNFKVFADPADSVISVMSGPGLNESKYRSPATIHAEVPTDPALAARAVLEVKRENYKPMTIALRDIQNGQALNIKLEKIIRDMVRYRLTYRLVSPVASQTLQYKDSNISVSFAVSEQEFQMRIENLTFHELKILWERAQYTDVHKQTYRLMHSGIRFQDRHDPIPDQALRAHSALQEAVIPVGKVIFSQQKKTYDVQPLFTLNNDTAAGLKGEVFNLFIPIEVNRAIIPYNFKIEITDSVKETIKG